MSTYMAKKSALLCTNIDNVNMACTSCFLLRIYTKQCKYKLMWTDTDSHNESTQML